MDEKRINGGYDHLKGDYVTVRINMWRSGVLLRAHTSLGESTLLTPEAALELSAALREAAEGILNQKTSEK